MGRLIIYLAALICYGGLGLRIAARVTANVGFTHEIQTSKRDNHELTTHGVYSFSRHPGYCGWWFFAVFSQVILCNPICIGLYGMAATKFFQDRVPYEEQHLTWMFKEKYANYIKSVPHRIPFVEDMHYGSSNNSVVRSNVDEKAFEDSQ